LTIRIIRPLKVRLDHVGACYLLDITIQYYQNTYQKGFLQGLNLESHRILKYSVYCTPLIV